MGFYLGFPIELVTLFAMGAAQWQIGRAALSYARRRWPVVWARATRVAIAAAGTAVIVGLALSAPNVGVLPLHTRFFGYLRGIAMLWAFTSTAAWLIFRFLRLFRWHTEVMDPGRRRLLRAAGTAAVAAPFAVVGFGALVERTDFRVREIDIPVPDLHPDLQGLRLVQLSDIHLSPFLSEKEFARVVDAANELRPHLMLVTGDLISVRGDPLDACVHQLARLRSTAGILS